MPDAKIVCEGEFLNVSREELDRARRRVGEPQWRTAADRLREEAEGAAGRWGELPAFDSGWFDARPDRDYGETYNEFAAYAYPAWKLLQDALKMLLADAVFNQDRFSGKALEWTMHVVRHFRFHVMHHDSGLSYSHVADALGNIFAFAGGRLPEADRAACLAQCEACGEALRRSTRHWLKNLAFMPYNNHFAHHRLGLLAMGLVLARRDWIDEALGGPRSFGELLAGATTDDGLCYESSTLYHFATLIGLLKMAELVRHRPALGRDLYRETFANGRNLKQMFDAPLGLLLPSGELPAIGDCYARRDPLWRSHAGFYEMAFAIWGDARYAWLLRRAGERATQEGLLNGADNLDPAEPLAARSRLWVEHGYALLTSVEGDAYWDGRPTVAVLTGDLSGIHHHQDALSLQVVLGGRVWVEDVESTAVELQGFAAPIQRNFNRTMLAHNLVAVDEQDQADNPRVLPVVEFKNLPTCRTAAMSDAAGNLAPDVRRQRGVAVTAEYCLDLYQVASESRHTYDWLLHPRADGPVDYAGLEFAARELPDRPPYSTLRGASSAAVSAGRATIEWKQGEGRCRCDVLALGESGGPSPSEASFLSAELIRANWPTRSDLSGDWREMLMFRVAAARADCVARYQLAGVGPAWRVASAGRIFNGQGYEVRILLTSGAESRLHVLASL